MGFLAGAGVNGEVLGFMGAGGKGLRAALVQPDATIKTRTKVTTAAIT
ncbi:MAG: hypothetical protein ACYCX4_07075 [Bacillota bacterium]